MNTDELHDDLVRMGSQPVPEPRPEFVRSLLDRIQLGDDLPVPEPIQLVRRDPYARFRMVAVGAIAAALLSAVGVFSLFRDDSGTKITISAAPTSEATSGPLKEITVGSDGSVDLPDGQYKAKCPTNGSKIPTVNGAIACPGDEITLDVANKHIQNPGSGELAVPATGAATSTTTPPSTTPPSTALPAPVTTLAPPSPTTVPPGGQASASVVTTTTAPGTTSTTKPQPSEVPPQGGGGVAAAVSPTFELQSTPGDGAVTLSWPQYLGPNFGKYVILRTSSLDTLVDTPTYTRTGGKGDVVAERTPVTNTTYTETFEGSLPRNTLIVSYRVGVVDTSGQLVALSTTTTLQLAWEMKPASEDATPTTTMPGGGSGGAGDDPAPTTTVPAATPSTTAKG